MSVTFFFFLNQAYPLNLGFFSVGFFACSMMSSSSLSSYLLESLFLLQRICWDWWEMVLWLNPSWPLAVNADKKGLETGTAFMSFRHSAPVDSTELVTSSSSSVSNRLAEKAKRKIIFTLLVYLNPAFLQGPLVAWDVA